MIYKRLFLRINKNQLEKNNKKKLEIVCQIQLEMINKKKQSSSNLSNQKKIYRIHNSIKQQSQTKTK